MEKARRFRGEMKEAWEAAGWRERFAKQLKQHGVSEEMCEHIRERGREKENKDNK